MEAYLRQERLRRNWSLDWQWGRGRLRNACQKGPLLLPVSLWPSPPVQGGAWCRGLNFHLRGTAFGVHKKIEKYTNFFDRSLKFGRIKKKKKLMNLNVKAVF